MTDVKDGRRKKKILPKRSKKTKRISKEQIVSLECDLKNPLEEIKLCTTDWDKVYKDDIENGIGFDIDDVSGIDKKNNRSLAGIYSPNYGAELSDNSDNIDTYSCKCRELKGKFYFDEKHPIICPKCGFPVIKNTNNMEKTGWITLRKELHLIEPLYYFMIEKVISKKNLNNIVYYNKERDENGNVVVNMDFFDSNNPYYAIGMTGFYENFEEIMNYYKEKISGTPKLKAEKIEIYNFLINNKDKIFSNHFPIYTLLLRPILMIKNNMVFDKINPKFQRLLTTIVELNKTDTTTDIKDLKVLPLLYQAQIILNRIHKMIIETQISGKDGHIRGNMLGKIILFRPTKNSLIAG